MGVVTGNVAAGEKIEIRATGSVTGDLMSPRLVVADQTDSELTPRNLREAEAECVALLCCEAVGLGGAEESRGYVQSWWGLGNPIPERSAQRILKAADQILRTGRTLQPEETL